jgi:cytochrome c oxidase cbb3-type subunit 1
MWDYVKLVVLGLIALGAAVAANYARDLAYQVNAIEVTIFAAVAFIVVLRGMYEPKVVNEKEYMDDVIRAGLIATTFWGVIGFLAGVFIASQLAFPWLNFEFLQGMGNFGRLRPLHTSAVDHDVVLRGAAHLCDASLGRQLGMVGVLGL